MLNLNLCLKVEDSGSPLSPNAVKVSSQIKEDPFELPNIVQVISDPTMSCPPPSFFPWLTGGHMAVLFYELLLSSMLGHKKLKLVFSFINSTNKHKIQ